jgi:hypothetical protein
MCLNIVVTWLFKRKRNEIGYWPVLLPARAAGGRLAGAADFEHQLILEGSQVPQQGMNEKDHGEHFEYFLQAVLF